MQTENAPAHFKAEMHRLLDNANAERHAARRTFAQQRETLIEQARQGGAAEPDREVAKMFRQKLDDIDAKQHRDVDQLYVKYGWDRESKQFADHAQEPVQNAQQLEQAQNDRQAAREQDAQRAEELRSSLDQAIEHEAQAQDIDHGPEHDHDQGDQSQ